MTRQGRGVLGRPACVLTTQAALAATFGAASFDDATGLRPKEATLDPRTPPEGRRPVGSLPGPLDEAVVC